MTREQRRQAARDVLADAFDRRGTAYRNTAESIRSGYENLWLTTTLDVVADLMQRLGHEEDGPDEGDRTPAPHRAPPRAL